jgi:hypothetical protein
MDIDPQEVVSWKLEKLWNTTLILLDDEELSELEARNMNYAKFGIKIKIPIQYILKSYYTEYPSSGNAKVLGYGKCKLQSLWDEIEKRETILRKLIIDNVTDDNPLEAR